MFSSNKLVGGFFLCKKRWFIAQDSLLLTYQPLISQGITLENGSLVEGDVWLSSRPRHASGPVSLTIIIPILSASTFACVFLIKHDI